MGKGDDVAADWTSGYVAEIGYTYGYYRELNPLVARLAIISAGYHAPTITSACELGFGQGLSVNIHASAGAASWYGTDFNPAQAGFAKQLAATSGANAMLYDQDFAEFTRRDDLPEFDFIGLHGIWSWISAANQSLIVDFIHRRLKVGGILYISYNTHPGWSASVPLRHLLTLHSELMAPLGSNIVTRIDDAINFADSLFALDSAFVAANPSMAERVTKLKAQNRHYLAHEYFNRDWTPVHFSEMATTLTSAKLTYVCSANLIDHFDQVNLNEKQRKFLGDISNPIFRQTVRDLMVNQQFRRDYWIKGARPLSALARRELLEAQRVALVLPRSLVPMAITGARGDAKLNAEIYTPLLDLLADNRPKSLKQLAMALPADKITPQQLLEALLVLIGGGAVAPVQDDAAIARARQSCQQLNGFVASQSLATNDIQHWASPVTGSGIEISRFDQLFIAACAQGEKTPEDWSRSVWKILKSQNQKIVATNGVLNTDDENVDHLLTEAKSFLSYKGDVFKALELY